MKCICTKTCQIRIDGKIHLVEKGDVKELAELPANGRFISTDAPDYEVDFSKASEKELMETKWKFSEAKAFILASYDVELKKEEGDKKSDIVARILDARYRAVT